MIVLYCFFKFEKFSIWFRGSHTGGTFGTPHTYRWNNSLLWREVGDSSQSFSSDTLQGIWSE